MLVGLTGVKVLADNVQRGGLEGLQGAGRRQAHSGMHRYLTALAGTGTLCCARPAGSRLLPQFAHVPMRATRPFTWIQWEGQMHWLCICCLPGRWGGRACSPCHSALHLACRGCLQHRESKQSGSWRPAQEKVSG